MRIWIDLSNSPHVNLFAGIIGELQKEHSVLLTCRPLANTTELLDQTGLGYHVVGRHYGRRAVSKLAGFWVQTARLCRFLKGRRIDVGISQSSYYAPLVGRLLGFPSIYMNDNEHSKGNRPAFLFAHKVLVPEYVDPGKFGRRWAKSDKITLYPGVKEGIYLWRHKPRERSSSRVALGPFARNIFVRPEPSTAHYYKGGLNFIDELLAGLMGRYNLVVLPRSKAQEAYYRQPKFSGVYVPKRPLRLWEIMGSCDLFLGAGGTMTREAAVLGLPTISIYQGDLLDVDRFLIARQAMIHVKNPHADLVGRFLEDRGKRSADAELLRKGKQAHDLVVGSILGRGRDGCHGKGRRGAGGGSP
jgi:predicted glycosyltransferase